MTIEEKLDEFIKEYRTDQKENERKLNYDRNQNLMYIAWGFAIAMASFAATTSVNTTIQLVAGAESVICVLIGWNYYSRSRKWSKTRGKISK
jgi:hypothetical protein